MAERKIRIETPTFKTEASLLDEKRPKTCERIWKNLPFEGKAAIYKEEIYFDIPTEIEPENATEETQAGDVSYWPEGPAFCIFFGKSNPVSPVNTFGKIEKKIKKFENVRQGETIKVQKIE